MTQIIKSEKTCDCKPEWQIILDNLVYQDQTMLFRICRKMIIYLNRLNIEEIRNILEELNPRRISQNNEQTLGSNWPKPKGNVFIVEEVFNRVFEIAKIYVTDIELTIQLKHWIYQEHLNELSRILEKRHAPLAEVTEAVQKYLKIFSKKQNHIYEEIIGLRVALVSRFLSQNLTYINISKHFIKIIEMAKILNRTIGPSQGNGMLGGKSAGLVLARQIIMDIREKNPILKGVTTPKSRFLTSDALTEFLHYNALEEFVFTKYQNSEDIRKEKLFIEYIFKNSEFPPELLYGLNKILDDMEGKPLIIRSSSLLEDSFEASFSGKYKSLFISNTGTKEERFSSLLNAITEVYASTFGPDPIEYRRERGFIDFREEMGILIQQVVGTKIGKYYLPSFAGVAFSNNEFCWSKKLKREDGIVRLVAGLGTRAVDRTMEDYPVLIAPGQPNYKVNQSFEDTIRYSQQKIDVINLEKNSFETIKFTELIDYASDFPAFDKIVSLNRDGMLVEPNSIMTNFSKDNIIITFNNLIEKTQFIKQIHEILKELTKAYDCPVDVEFASDGHRLYLLQCRPQSEYIQRNLVTIPKDINQKNIIFTAEQNVSNGIVDDIEFIVYVDHQAYSNLENIEQLYMVGKIIGQLNRILPKKKFILLGPGRWGSKGDIKLGVPVIYSFINNTAMLIEVAHEKSGYIPELSFGTHFFQDLVEADIRYLPLYPDQDGIIFNYDILKNSPNELSNLIEDKSEYEEVIRVIKVSNISQGATLKVYMDGETNRAVAVIK